MSFPEPVSRWYETGKSASPYIAGANVELAWLEDFVALVASGQFSHAAENRNISQSGFSRRIKALEDWVGTALFVRGAKGVQLTAAGEQFRPFAEDALRKILLAREQALDAVRVEKGALTFASTHALSLTFFPKWLRELNSVVSLSATVRLVADNMVACERLMLHGQAQFLLCHHHPMAAIALEENHFRSMRLGTDILVPTCIPDPNDPSSPKYFIKDGKTFPLLAYSGESGMGRILAASLPFIAQRNRHDVEFRSHVAAVLHAMAKDGAGVAWLPLSLISDDLASKRLIITGDQNLQIPVDIVLIRHRSRQSSAGEALWKAAVDFSDETGLNRPKFAGGRFV